ncbi:MAG TPA: hypothetical protein PLE79_07220 [Clostridia bacterium]|nr:hypothetical protein [Clostridia bacterium]
MRWLKSAMLVCAAGICITACTFAPSLEQTASASKQAAAPVPGQTALSEETVSAFQDEPEPAPSASPVEETELNPKAKAEHASEEAYSDKAQSAAAIAPSTEDLEEFLGDKGAEKDDLTSTDCSKYALQPLDAAPIISDGENSLREKDLRQTLERFELTSELEIEKVKVTFNSDALFSCLVFSGSSKQASLRPITIDKATGSECRLADFFSHTDTSWKALLRDIVYDEALARGLTLLCDIPPVPGNHPFYIDKGVIVLVYRPFEITTFEAGSPCFELPMDEIGPYLTGAYGIGA